MKKTIKYLIFFLPLLGCVYQNKEYKHTNMKQFHEIKELNKLLLLSIPKDSFFVFNGNNGVNVYQFDSTTLSEKDSIKFISLTTKNFLYISGSRKLGYEYEYESSFGKDLSTTTFYNYLFYEGNIKNYHRLNSVNETILLNKIEQNWYKWIYID